VSLTKLISVGIAEDVFKMIERLKVISKGGL